MRSNSFPFVLAPLRRSLRLFWRETHTKDCGRNLPWDRKWRREDREGVSWQRMAEEDGRLEIAVQKEAVREDNQRWVSIPSSFVEVSHKIHACYVYKCMESCTKVLQRLLPSCTRSWPKSMFVCLFFLPASRLYFTWP